MKKLALMFLALISFQSFALDVTTQAPIATTAFTTFISTGNICKEDAAQVLNDSQELMATGMMSEFLGQKIRDARQEGSSASDLEILDVLILASEQALK